MTLNELIRAVDALSEDDLRQLRDYVNQRHLQEQPAGLRAGTMNVDALMRVVD